jgi:hypothetical protein
MIDPLSPQLVALDEEEEEDEEGDGEDDDGE